MNYNQLGNFAAGIGNWIISIDKEPISDLSGNENDPQWLNNHTLIYQNNQGTTSVLEKFDTITREKTIVDLLGANVLIARRNIWLAYLSIGDQRTRFSNGNFIPYSRPWSIGDDDSILLSNSDNTVLSIFDLNGHLLRQINTGPILQAFHSDVHNVSYLRTNKTFVWNEHPFELLPNPANIKEIFPNHLCYQTGEEAVLHDINYIGWNFGSYGKTYLPDAYIISNGNASVVYATNAAEVPQSIIELTLPAQNKINVKPVSPEPIMIKTNNAYPRRIFFCPYQSYNTRPDWGVTPRYVGNVVMPDPEFYKDMTLSLIQPYGRIDLQYINTTLAYYLHCNGSNIENGMRHYQDLIDNCPDKPIIYYFDKSQWPDDLPAGMNPNKTWLGVQCYRNQNESITGLESRMHKLLLHVSDFNLPLVLTLGFYDRSFLTRDEIIECMPIYDDLIREYFVIGVMPFSDCRPGGMEQYKLYDYAEAIFNAIPERPNRYDYWVSNNYRQDMKQQLNYSSLVLSEQQRKVWKGIIG